MINEYDKIMNEVYRHWLRNEKSKYPNFNDYVDTLKQQSNQLKKGEYITINPNL